MAKDSKYNETHQSRVPRPHHSKKVDGSGLDDGKWFRCKICNFICNIDRDSIGDGEGIAYPSVTYPLTYTYSDLTTTPVTQSTISVAFDTHNTGSSPTMIAPDVVGGCPQCGSRNWK